MHPETRMLHMAIISSYVEHIEMMIRPWNFRMLTMLLFLYKAHMFAYYLCAETQRSLKLQTNRAKQNVEAARRKLWCNIYIQFYISLCQMHARKRIHGRTGSWMMI